MLYAEICQSTSLSSNSLIQRAYRGQAANTNDTDWSHPPGGQTHTHQYTSISLIFDIYLYFGGIQM
jgi:hypothetical protein